nr:hypothetical protein CFP56_63082 [Quercus suber]
MTCIPTSMVAGLLGEIAHFAILLEMNASHAANHLESFLHGCIPKDSSSLMRTSYAPVWERSVMSWITRLRDPSPSETFFWLLDQPSFPAQSTMPWSLASKKFMMGGVGILVDVASISPSRHKGKKDEKIVDNALSCPAWMPLRFDKTPLLIEEDP